MKGFLKLGKVSGVDVQIHWTFALLLIWAGYVEFQDSGDLQRVLINQGFILVLMVCVVLHELGHAFAAKQFNIKTQKIILLPIGGVATLEKMPEKPGQELLVALAGPAVNLIIAIVLALLVPIKSYFSFEAIVIEEMLYAPTLQNFLFYLFIANVMLVLFNLIPAFPMDGGRVFRALLSYKLGRVEATKIATGVGQALAFVFFVFGFFLNPFLILIAFFIFFSAYGESQMVQQESILKGHTVKEATLTDISILTPNNSVKEVVDIILSGTERDFIVAENDKAVGIITQKDIIKNVKIPSVQIKDIMLKDFKTIESTVEISTVLELFGKEKNKFFPVTENGQLIGAIDIYNVSEFMILKK